MNIIISNLIWIYLNKNKRPGESFDEVLIRLLGLKKELTIE